MKHFDKIVLLAMLVLVSCQSESEKPNQNDTDQRTLFTAMPSSSTGIDFLNKVENEKEMNIFKYRNFYNGGGVAIGDINNDGLTDIYFTGNMVPNKLYLNKGDFKFVDITEAAGVQGTKPWSTGVVMVDINQDGFLDIYVSNSGNPEGNNHNNELFINNGDLTFTEKAEEHNLAKTGFSTQASFFDYDKDGDLDAYILNNSNIPVSSLGYSAHRQVRARDWDVPDVFRGVGDLLLRNDDGVFKDVTEEAGIYGSLIGFGLGIYVTDINQDLYPDIYISNDFYERDYLYINNQDGTFTEDIKNWTSHLCLSAMGIDMGDINNDGLNDVFVTDMLPEENKRIKSVMQFENYNVFDLKRSKDFYQQYIQNTLQVNNGNGTFSETAYFSGIAKTDWSWAGLIFDMDNDGNRDIYVTNGINHDLTDIDFVDFFADEVIQKMVVTGEKEDLLQVVDKMPQVKLENYAYKNEGDLKFSKANKEWGLDIPSFSNGCAYADLDNDGDLDIVVNNVNMESFVFRNNANEITDHHHLRIKLEGSDKNKFGIGTAIRLYADGQVFFKEQMPSRGFQSSVDYTLNFGLGSISQIDSIRVIWPDDATQMIQSVQVDKTITLKRSEATDKFSYPKNEEEGKTFFKEVNNDALKEHKEDLFNDFDHEGLIGTKLSQEGPAIAVADVNDDGHEDVFVGAAKGEEAVIYLHSGNGKLRTTTHPCFAKDKGYEDTAAAFFDADGDGDMDLMVGSGGNNPREAKNYHNRLYINDGRGNFSKSTTTLPTTKHNVSVIKPKDFDEDGDVDVFIGSRSVPGIYGIDPDHLFLINNGDGTFKDATERYAFDVKEAGMITAADWVDVNADGKSDLVTVSDWGPPMVFRNSGRRLSRLNTSLDSLHGWWNTLKPVDIDQDGDMDFILGNKGENLPYKAYADRPMKMWINDYDNNGTIEQITTVRENNGDYPIHMRKEITAQLTYLKKQNLKASDYASRTINDLFKEGVIKNTIVKKSNTMSSVIAINEGNNKYTIKKLPYRSQLSCICDIVCRDFNKDGNLDILTAGNNFEFKPQFSRLDASQGDLLLGDGNLNFTWQRYDKTGLGIRNEVKHLAAFKDASNNEFLMAAINEESPKVYKLNP